MSLREHLSVFVAAPIAVHSSVTVGCFARASRSALIPCLMAASVALGCGEGQTGSETMTSGSTSGTTTSTGATTTTTGTNSTTTTTTNTGTSSTATTTQTTSSTSTSTATSTATTSTGTSSSSSTATSTGVETSSTTSAATSTEVTTSQATTETASESTSGETSQAPAAGAEVSDDFEAATAGSAPNSEFWQLPMGRPEGAVVVSAEQKHSGAQSVKVTYGNGAGPSMFYNTSLFPLPGGVIHFRAWVWFESTWETHVSFASAGPLPIEDYNNEVRFGGQHEIYYLNDSKTDDFTPDPWSCTTCVHPVAKTWTCLRGMLDFGSNQATLQVGDEVAVDLMRDGWGHGSNATFPDPARFGLGFIDHNGGANTAYFDDVALGYEPIPCE